MGAPPIPALPASTVVLGFEVLFSTSLVYVLVDGPTSTFEFCKLGRVEIVDSVVLVVADKVLSWKTRHEPCLAAALENIEEEERMPVTAARWASEGGSSEVLHSARGSLDHKTLASPHSCAPANFVRF